MNEGRNEMNAGPENGRGKKDIKRKTLKGRKE